MADPESPPTGNPEIGLSVDAGGIATNYHDVGGGHPVVLIHGSGPGVSAWANWSTAIYTLSQHFRVIAPDIVGFGYTERPAGFAYTPEAWVRHLGAFLDALGLDGVHLVGNSFGGALSLQLAAQTSRVDRIVLMGSAGVRFDLTAGLDTVWGYEPSLDNMRQMLQIFAFDQAIVTEDLVRMRYEASVRPGVQEAYSAMFPAPRQQWVEMLALLESEIQGLPHEVLIIHGREDRVVPVEASWRLAQLIDRSQLHVFGRCGHWTQIECNERFVELVSSFLGETPDSRKGETHVGSGS